MKNLFYIIGLVLATSTGSFAQGEHTIRFEGYTETTIPAKNKKKESKVTATKTLESIIVSDGDTYYSKTVLATYGLTIEYEITKDETTVKQTSGSGIVTVYQGKTEAYQSQNKQKNKQVEITDETMEISGYECTKAIITTDDKTYDYWFTEDLDPIEYLETNMEEINGVVLMTSNVLFENTNLVIKAVDVKEDVDMDLYKIEIPDDIEIKPLDELFTDGSNSDETDDSEE